MPDSTLLEGAQSVSLAPHLLITKGLQRYEIVPLDFVHLKEKPLVLGRSSDDADFVLRSPKNRVSRRHAVLTYRPSDQMLTVADAGSSNGTRLNGEHIAGTIPLLAGDTIACGDVELVYVVPTIGLGIPLALLPNQTGRECIEDCEAGVARLEIITSKVPNLREGAFCRLTPNHDFSIGRYTTSDLPLLEEGDEARQVSRRQAEIRAFGSHYVIYDAGAANPTWVNQDQLASFRQLADGDSLQIGSTLLRYRAPRLPLGVTKIATDTAQILQAVLRFDGKRTLETGVAQLALPIDRQLLIGRSVGNDLQLRDKSVSRRHARLFYEAQHFMLTDLGSANGIKVNNQAIGDVSVLQFGDRLKIGQFEFVFEKFDEAQSAVEPTETVIYELNADLAAQADGGSPAVPSQTTSFNVEFVAHPLRQIVPFNELDSATYRLLLPYFKEVSYKAGQEIIHEGQGRGAFFVILEGRVSISRALNERQRLVLGELEAGSIYGERSIYADQPFVNRLEAVNDVQALRLDESTFVRDLSRNRQVLTFFQQQVSAASAATWLRATLLMRTLSENTRQEIAKRLRYRVYQAGENLCEKGQDADEFFLVLAGKALAYLEDGKRILATLEEGDTFGDGIAAAGETYPMTVRAENMLECYVLTRADFESVLARSGDPVAHFGSSLIGLPVGAVLNRVGPFVTLPPQLVAKIAAEMKPKFFRKGEKIVSQDEPASAFYIIRSGKVEVSFKTSEGEIRSDMELGAGQYFGEASLLTNTARTDTVIAIEDCELLALYRNKLDSVLKLGEGYDLGQYFAKSLTLRFRPKRIAEVEVSEHTSATGEHYYLLSRSGGEQFFKLSDRSLFLWNLMNGDNSLNDLSMAYFLEYSGFDLEGVSNLIGQLQAGGFLQVPQIDQSLVAQGQKRERKWFERIFNWRYEIKNVDQLFDKLYKYGGQVLFWRLVRPLLWFLMLGGFGAFVYFGFFDEQAAKTGIASIFQAGGIGALTTTGTLSWWALVGVLFVNFLIHETAHGLACKAYGRRVISGGFGWYYLGPVFFVNTNEIWRASRRARIVVNLVGPASNALFAGICCLLMFLTPDADLRTAFFQMAGVAYTLVYININPLMELDGYYALMDWLEIPGLRRKALTFVRRKVTRQPLRETPTVREQRIFWWFALLTPVYLIFTLLQFLFWFTQILGSALRSLGLNGEQVEPLGWLGGLIVVGFLAWPLFTELLRAGQED